MFMRVLLVGASGFIGRSIAAKVPEKVELTGTYFQNEPSLENVKIEQLNYLNSHIDWEQKIATYDCVILAARANADTEIKRNEISLKAQEAFSNLIQAVVASTSKPFIIVVNGSLSYGHRGDALVKIGEKIKPIGYARSYAIAEKPFRDFLTAGHDIAIIRAPWVIGPGSWFPMMYLATPRTPLLKSGKQWMSLVSVGDLAEFVWEVAASSKSGILHPKLTYRCRQKEFADIVSGVTSKPVRRIGLLRRWRMEPQMRESVLASIKLDDGMGYQSERQVNEKRLTSIIEEIYTSFS